MTTTHLILRYAHISMGMLALLSGAGAMVFRKGSPLHRKTGDVFVVSMLFMASSGLYMSIFPERNLGNVMGAMLALYLTATAWAVAWRKPGKTGRLEIVLALLGLTTAICGIAFGFNATSSPKGRLDGYPATFFFTFGSIALLATLLDVRMLARGGFTGTARLTRHLSRMCLAMFMATASFFLGQAKLFSPAVRESGILKIPVLLVIGALIYWLIRVRVWPSIRKLWAPRMAQSLPTR